MTSALSNPAFGQADLTNCERELIHLAGSIQPYGSLLVLSARDLVILQASENAEQILGLAYEGLLGQSASVLGGNLPDTLRAAVKALESVDRRPLRCFTEIHNKRRHLEGVAHRHPGGELIVELEPVAIQDCEDSLSREAALQNSLLSAVQHFSGMMTIATLADAVATYFRDMTGFDRAMVYKFDPDGHGEIISEARAPELDSLLGHRYPATDIPQRARELYIRNRARVLVDVNYEAVPIIPRRVPTTGEELDMSLCYLRSMSPLHLQYLKNMGVTGTLVVSLVREGQLWGLIACHHYSPRPVSYAERAISELLAEVISTRIAAIENYVQAQVEVIVRRLELRLIEAASTDGDWRYALFKNPRALLQPVEATGAALFWDEEILTAGEVPSTRELRNLAKWVRGQTSHSLFSCSSVERANQDLSSLTPTASGVLAFQLSQSRQDFLMWFRREQLCTVKWAGDPSKPVLDNDPLHLSPRRSFATWLETVRGTAVPWSRSDIAVARAVGTALTDIIFQIHAVRLLIAQDQLARIRKEVERAREPVVLADANGVILFCNEAFERLLRLPHVHLNALEDIARFFTEPQRARELLHRVREYLEPWRGELNLGLAGQPGIPVKLRAEVIPGQDGTMLGFIVILTDMSERKAAEAARRRFERSVSDAGAQVSTLDPSSFALEPDEVIGAILANAKVAAMEVTDAGEGSLVAPILDEIETSVRRAAKLYYELRNYTRDPEE